MEITVSFIVIGQRVSELVDGLPVAASDVANDGLWNFVADLPNLIDHPGPVRINALSPNDQRLPPLRLDVGPEL